MSINYFDVLPLDLSVARDNIEVHVNATRLWTDLSDKGDSGEFKIKLENNSPSTDSITIKNDLNIRSTAGSIERIYISNDAQSGKHVNLYYSNFIDYNRLTAGGSSSSGGSGGSSSSSDGDVVVHAATIDIPVATSGYTEIFPANANRLWVAIVTRKSDFFVRTDPAVAGNFEQRSNYFYHPKGSFGELAYSPKALYTKTALYARTTSSSIPAIDKTQYFIVEATGTSSKAVIDTFSGNIRASSTGIDLIVNENPKRTEALIMNNKYITTGAVRLYGDQTNPTADLKTTLNYKQMYRHTGSGPVFASHSGSSGADADLRIIQIINP